MHPDNPTPIPEPKSARYSGIYARLGLMNVHKQGENRRELGKGVVKIIVWPLAFLWDTISFSTLLIRSIEMTLLLVALFSGGVYLARYVVSQVFFTGFANNVFDFLPAGQVGVAYFPPVLLAILVYLFVGFVYDTLKYVVMMFWITLPLFGFYMTVAGTMAALVLYQIASMIG